MANKRIYDLEKQSVIANDHAVVIDKSGQDEATYTSIADLFSKFQDEVEITEEQISDFGEYLTSISGLNISELNNDVGYITDYTETDPVFSAWDKSTGISITEEQISDFGEYLTSISGLNISELTNDSFFIASNTTGVTGADQITNIMSLTTAEYEAIGSPNSSTLYIITDA